MMHEGSDGHEVGTRCISRSTSAGSRTPPLGENDDKPFVVRNTFIENTVGRAASLEGFFHEREIYSCPASRPTSVDGPPPGLEALLENLGHALEGLPGSVATTSRVGRPLSLDDFFFEQRNARACPVSWGPPSDTISLPPMLHRLLSGIEEGPFESSVDSPVEAPRFVHGETARAPTKIASTAAFPMMFPPPLTEQAPVPYQCEDVLHPLTAASFQEARIVRLADALPERMVGSFDVPTVGSIGHHSGDCKPCAFLYIKGCSNGVHCTFCHLCSPGEKKKRKQEKKELGRQTRSARL